MDIREINRKTIEAFHVGAPRHPDWYLNLAANPQVTFFAEHEAGTERVIPVVAISRATGAMTQ